MFVALIEFIIEAVTSARCIRIQLKRARVIANIDASSQKATEISLLFPAGPVGARRADPTDANINLDLHICAFAN